ncbi:[histone H3]-lysine(4) N-trimethyltransferase [Trifolium repens]|nr:[histone H3]-lysine(4) N-trimethyltransferase [Trifolium repens]
MNSEPPRGTVESMSLFNGHSEQELGIPLMENGGSSILARPMVKRCAVSAFRDFPEACDFPDAFRELGILLMENGGSSILARPMVKRCAVSAFRDFPEAFREFLLVPKSHGVNVPPLGRENDPMARNKVRNALRLFQAVSRQLLQEAEAKAKSNEKERRRFDLQAAKILKEKGNYVNEGGKILGSVPGVEVGDKFHYRIELNIIGLHRQIQGGQGGNVMSSDKDPEDQKLERGNLALKNSSEEKNPVRVIRGSESVDGKSKIYVYDGLYLVESCWQEMGSHGKLVYKFRLRRIPGQPELALKEVKQSKIG